MTGLLPGPVDLPEESLAIAPHIIQVENSDLFHDPAAEVANTRRLDHLPETYFDDLIPAFNLPDAPAEDFFRPVLAQEWPLME